MSKTLQRAEQFRRALQVFAMSLTDEQALEIATVYDEWMPQKAYKNGDLFIYGENNVGDPQLYRVVSNHVSQANWLPNNTPALYDAIGLDSSGHPIWSQPTGVHDAYNTGDIVNYNGVLYESIINGNVYSPDTYPAGWRVVR